MIEIYGTPDGGVRVSGARAGDGVFDAYDPGADGMLLWSAILRGDDGQEMRVIGVHDGTWSFGLGQTDEDTPLPDWEMRVSTRLEVDAPDADLPKHGPRETPLPPTVQLRVWPGAVKIRLADVKSAGRRRRRVRPA
ncbi:hypothetical protein [Actinomadura violacea]|uniref:Uncharacterized protein n=1 Tax=Actinomadura violacea TaxID=2819934 RepID=A0ABS3RXZ4_9ACTN|nr:hypothetical protein [Actinomadura violacea]MBO2461610.1 hypothetical protein [Actinomadura violacea]